MADAVAVVAAARSRETYGSTLAWTSNISFPSWRLIEPSDQRIMRLLDCLICNGLLSTLLESKRRSDALPSIRPVLLSTSTASYSELPI
jgi:hypothetical protein